MAATSFGMTGMPGSNPGGTQISVPTPDNSNTPAIGGGSNPFLPTFPGGTSTAPMSSTVDSATPFGNLSQLLGFGNGTNNPLHDLTKAFEKAGFSSGIGGELANFLQSGAGFNPQVLQALFAAMQPQIQRGEADIMEQFSNMGLRSGSPAGVGLGDYLSQVNLNEGQIAAQMYEQSVQNYLSVLLAGKGNAPKSTFDNILAGLNTIANFTGKGGGGGGGSDSSVASPSDFPVSPDGQG